ncbi:MAG: hypothetical protein LLG00_16680 [Planctomycetaceae bacterium]|nr:hypothetical protein [Planctomycetaceae bacterium]
MEQPKLPIGTAVDSQGGYGLSPAVWANMPIAHIFSGQKDYGVGLLDNFVSLGLVTALGTSRAAYVSDGIVYRSYELVGGSSAAGVSAKTAAAARPGGIVLTTGGSADDQVAIQAGAITASANIVPFSLIPGTSKDLAFECYFKVSSVAADTFDFFLGLAGSGCAVSALPITASDVLGSASMVGVSKLRAATTSLSLGYNRASGTPAAKTGVGTLAADTYVKAGFRWFGQTGTLMPFVNGVAIPTCAVTSSVSAATPWPNDYMTLCASIVNYTTTAVSLTLDWWAVAQVL